MTVRELRAMLDEWHPDENVVCLASQSHRIMQILGPNAEFCDANKCLVLEVDWSVVEGRIVESETDRIRRERDRLTAEINKLRVGERRELEKKVHKKGKKYRSKAEQMIAEALGPAKKGRPKKVQPDEDSAPFLAPSKENPR